MKTGFTIRQFQRQFFNSRAVRSAVDRGRRQALSRFGAFTRRSARQSLRRRRRASRPGEAPTNRKGQLKRFLFFGYEPTSESVVIGPAKLSRSSFSIPEILEHGGTAVVANRKRRRVRARYAARPFMQPAFEKEQQKLPQLWKDAIST